MKMTIYVPDDLAELLKAHDDLNVSAVCQAALHEELGKRAALAELQDGMDRVEVYVEEGGDVAFIGKEVAYDGRHITVYLTRRGRIAIHDGDAQVLYQFESFKEWASDDVWEFGHEQLVSDVARALGEKHVIELDI